MKILRNIQSKFIAVSIIAVLLVIGLALTERWAANVEQKQASSLRLIAMIMQRHMEGDMMHDAMRGDVLAAILAGAQSESAHLDQASKELDEHHQNFKSNLEKNNAEQLPAHIKALFDKALIALAHYHGAAKNVVVLVKAGQPYKEALKEFNGKFDIMETENEAISNEIGKWAESEEKYIGRITEITANLSIVLSIIASLAVIFIPLYAWIKLFKPQHNIIENMKTMAKGNYSIVINGEKRSDEIGEMAKALNVFKVNGYERLRLENEQKATHQRSEFEKRRAMNELADRFEAKVHGIIHSVASASTELYHTSESLNQIIETACKKANNVSIASGETSQNVDKVATATEQMFSSVQQMSEQITLSAEAVNAAVVEMKRADETSRLLNEATPRIGEIVGLIQNIAGQINLLALNASIESARAGEAGKGFAVVAGEVKQLASQTTKATDEISGNIGNIRTVAEQVIHALEAIKYAINSIDKISTSISSAIGEQTAVTNEIASNMSRASNSTSRIYQDIAEVNQASIEASTAAQQTVSATRLLSQQTENLASEVKMFLDEIRAS